MILEIGKSYVNKFYNGKLKDAVKAKDGILWTSEKIKNAFNNGNGNKTDLKKHIDSNKNFAYFVEI